MSYSKAIGFSLLIMLLNTDFAMAGDKTQAWGGRVNGLIAGTMRNRNQNARIWIGEQARGWGAGSRITNSLTTSMAFHLQSTRNAQQALAINQNEPNNFTSSACGTCFNYQNTGNGFSIGNNAVTSTNSGSVTSTSLFNN